MEAKARKKLERAVYGATGKFARTGYAAGSTGSVLVLVAGVGTCLVPLSGMTEEELLAVARTKLSLYSRGVPLTKASATLAAALAAATWVPRTEAEIAEIVSAALARPTETLTRVEEAK